VTGVVSEHDDRAGSLRGANIIYVLEMGGLRICHLGDFGQPALRDAQPEAIGAVDLLMLPVGGGSTISPEGAAVVAERLAPRWVLPMHFRTPYVDFMESLESYLAFVDDVARLESSSFDPAELPDKADTTTLVLPIP
jgi:L-ascorbate metabolism protein UlaG (beta-lactamase superfamily)